MAVGMVAKGRLSKNIDDRIITFYANVLQRFV